MEKEEGSLTKSENAVRLEQGEVKADPQEARGAAYVVPLTNSSTYSSNSWLSAPRSLQTQLALSLLILESICPSPSLQAPKSISYHLSPGLLQ